MTKDIEKMITSCTTHQRFQAKQCDTPLEKHPRPDHPWSVVASDLFDFDRGQYMVKADMYSKMFFVQKMPSSGATTAAVVSKMKEIFAKHGIPDVLRSDNGPQYASAAFQEFTRNWEFKHITSSAHHPASNGFAESMVKIVKTALSKAKYSDNDPQLALLALHSTPVDAHLTSPAQILFLCKLKTRLPTQPGNTDPCAEEHQGWLDEKADQAKANHDCRARIQLPLFTGQTISILDPSRNIWIPGTVMRKLHHQSYIVKTTAGAVYRCTRKHLHEKQVCKPDLEPPSTDLDVSTKAQPHVHVPLNPVSNHAAAAAPQPRSAATQCTIPSAPLHHTHAKHSPEAVQASTEAKVPVPPSVPVAKVPASLTSHTSMAPH